jgi:hypothetical protein
VFLVQIGLPSLFALQLSFDGPIILDIAAWLCRCQISFLVVPAITADVPVFGPQVVGGVWRVLRIPNVILALRVYQEDVADLSAPLHALLGVTMGAGTPPSNFVQKILRSKN